jgi:hypothetical protein
MEVQVRRARLMEEEAGRKASSMEGGLEYVLTDGDVWYTIDWSGRELRHKRR